MMRTIVLIAFVLVGANALCYDTSAPVAQPNLTFCAEYASSACCSPQTEGLLYQHIAGYGSFFGNGGCKENVRRIGCAFICDPNNVAFVNVTDTNPLTLTGSFTDFLTDSLYTSCQGVCVDNSGTIGARYNTSDSFLSSLNLAAQSPAPAIIFSNGGAAGYNGTLDVASPSDNCRCSDGTGPTPQPTLSLCTEYRSSACCIKLYEDLLIDAFASHTQFGTSNCAENVRRVGCSFICGPNNGAYVSATLAEFRGNFTSTLANAAYDSCKGRCFNGSNTIAQTFPNATAFIASLNVPQAGANPAVTFVVSNSGSAYNGTMLPAGAADLAGCASTDTDTDSGAVHLSVSSFLLLVAAFFSL